MCVCAGGSVLCNPCVFSKVNDSPSVTLWHSQSFSIERFHLTASHKLGIFRKVRRCRILFLIYFLCYIELPCSKASRYGLFLSPFLDLNQQLVNPGDFLMLRMIMSKAIIKDGRLEAVGLLEEPKQRMKNKFSTCIPHR